MKRILSYSLLGVVAYLLFLLLLAPATLVTDLLGARLPGFDVQAVEGTATKGSMLGARWRGIRLDRLRWQWRPLALLTGRLAFRLNTDDSEVKLNGSAAVGLNRRLRFQDLTGGLPLARLGPLAQAAKLPLQGNTEFTLRELDLDASGRPLAAHGVVHLLNLRTTVGRPLNIGDFVVQLDSPNAEGIQGKIKDSNGPLALEGTLNLLPDGRYHFTGQAAIRDTSNSALRQAMNLLGPPGGDGRWALNFSGILAL